jgi:hypothetical protein
MSALDFEHKSVNRGTLNGCPITESENIHIIFPIWSGTSPGAWIFVGEPRNCLVNSDGSYHKQGTINSVESMRNFVSRADCGWTHYERNRAIAPSKIQDLLQARCVAKLR